MAELVVRATAGVALAAAEDIAALLRQVIAARGFASLGIPGGSAITPLPFLRERLGAHWQQIHLTWVDERCVDYSHEDSNRGTAYRAGALDEKDPPALEVPLWLDGELPAAAVARVTQVLRDRWAGALDVALLGMGPDGHIASLFPGHELVTQPSSALVAVLRDSPKPPAQRMTLTPAQLSKTGNNFLLALGESKREALSRILEGDLALPATRLRNLVIYTDLDNLPTPSAAS